MKTIHPIEYNGRKEEEFAALVYAERLTQHMKYGRVHDEGHTLPEWSMIITRYHGRIADRAERITMLLHKLNSGDYDHERDTIVHHITYHRRGMGDDIVKLAAVCQAMFAIWDSRMPEGSDAETDSANVEEGEADYRSRD